MIRADGFKGQNVAVFGLGKSGMATVYSLLEGGAQVYAWDDNAVTREQLSALRLHQVTVSNPETWEWTSFKTLVLSPGIALYYPAPHPIVALARNAKCEIICDHEVLYRTCPKATYVGITGTNGKSTTTSLIYHILEQSKQSVQIGGNIGVPVLSLNEMAQEEIFVLEMSSYQLDLLDKMHFNVSVLLNVTPDHLDRHNTMDEYVAAKKRIFSHQVAQDYAVIGVDDVYGVALALELEKQKIQRVIRISGQRKLKKGISVLENVIYDDTGIIPKEINIGQLTHLKGEHNAQNIAASYAAIKHFAIEDKVIVKAIQSFVGLDHRMQYVATIKNVAFYNDSKATNADATAKALTISKHIYWIIGGQAKAGGIASLTDYFPAIEHAYIIGAAQEEFANTLEGRVAYTKVGVLEKAVDLATQAAIASGYEDAVILLSPACASFDQFANFMARGEKFCQLVQEEKNKYR